jgi:large subunit ribosomal protein L31
MKKDIHPKNYRAVVFRDSGADKSWIMNSLVETSKTTTWEDGKEYPLFDVTISSYSHPFYTGKQQIVDAEGRVDKFRKKYGM